MTAQLHRRNGLWRVTIWDDESGTPDRTLFTDSLWSALKLWWGMR